MADEWTVKLVADQMRLAGDLGESRTTAGLQAQVGAGAADMQAALDELREQGLVSMVAPGEFEWISEELRGERELVREAAEAGPNQEPGLQWVTLPRLDVGGPPEIVLSTAMIKVLSDEALGQLVRAGVESQPGSFVLRVEP